MSESLIILAVEKMIDSEKDPAQIMSTLKLNKPDLDEIVLKLEKEKNTALRRLDDKLKKLDKKGKYLVSKERELNNWRYRIREKNERALREMERITKQGQYLTEHNNTLKNTIQMLQGERAAIIDNLVVDITKSIFIEFSSIFYDIDDDTIGDTISEGDYRYQFILLIEDIIKVHLDEESRWPWDIEPRRYKRLNRQILNCVSKCLIPLKKEIISRVERRYNREVIKGCESGRIYLRYFCPHCRNEILKVPLGALQATLEFPIQSLATRMNQTAIQ